MSQRMLKFQLYPNGARRNTSRIYKYGELDRDYNASLNILERGLSGQELPLEPVNIEPLREIPASSVIEAGSHHF